MPCSEEVVHVGDGFVVWLGSGKYFIAFERDRVDHRSSG